jgi:hypothetical protein
VFNNLNPNWATIIFLDGYKFGVPFYIEVGVFDFDAKAAGTTEARLQLNDAHTNLHIVCDASSRNLLRNGKFPHRVMGTALFEVGEILGSRGNVGSKSLQTGGAVYAHIERCREDGEKGKLRFQMRAFRLKNTQSLGMTSSPFFELLRKVDRPTGATWYVRKLKCRIVCQHCENDSYILIHACMYICSLSFHFFHVINQ